MDGTQLNSSLHPLLHPSSSLSPLPTWESAAPYFLPFTFYLLFIYGSCFSYNINHRTLNLGHLIDSTNIVVSRCIHVPISDLHVMYFRVNFLQLPTKAEEGGVITCTHHLLM